MYASDFAGPELQRYPPTHFSRISAEDIQAKDINLGLGSSVPVTWKRNFVAGATRGVARSSRQESKAFLGVCARVMFALPQGSSSAARCQRALRFCSCGASPMGKTEVMLSLRNARSVNASV
jgi:hypothetical protein